MLAAEICLLPAGNCITTVKKSKLKVKTMTSVHAEGDDRPELLTLYAREVAEYFDCLALGQFGLGEYCFRISLLCL
jgi:hypothetical protein